MSTPLTLAHVLPSWIQAKEDERKAIEHRRSLDKMIQDLLPKKDEGSISQADGDYKVTVTYAVTRKADTEKLQKEWANLPPEVASVFRWKSEVSVSELRKLGGADAIIAASFITATPSAASVKVELTQAPE